MQRQVLTVKNPIVAILAPNILNSLSSILNFGQIFIPQPHIFILESSFCPHQRLPNRVYYCNVYGPHLPQIFTDTNPQSSQIPGYPSPHISKELEI